MTPILCLRLAACRALGTQLSRASSLIRSSEYLKTAMVGQTICKRSQSTSVIPSLHGDLTKGREAVLRFSQLPPLQKVEALTCAAVSLQMGMSNLIPPDQLQQYWETLASHIPPTRPSVADYNPENPYANFLEIFSRHSRPLLRGRVIDEYSSKEFIRTYTELVWSTQQPLVPLGYDREPQRHTIPISKKLQNNPVVRYLFDSTEEDGVAAWILATPEIDAGTFIHEYGCWNGGNLLGLLFFGLENGVYPGGCLGTDINMGALNVAEATAHMFSLSPSLVQFHLSNALYPTVIDISQFNCQKQVKIALRLIPVLEPSDAKDFLIQSKLSMTQDCSLIVSYALPKGNKYETNKELASSSQYSVKEDTFDEGIIFRTPFDSPTRFSQLVEFPERIDQVINCYYTKEGFENLANRCGYEVVKSITVGEFSDNYRIVVALKIKQ